MPTVELLARLNPSEVSHVIGRFKEGYALDWNRWQTLCSTEDLHSPIIVSEFGAILRRWQATRPMPMRRPRNEADHDEPFLDDLVSEALPHLNTLGNQSVRDVENLSPDRYGALTALWNVFYNLPYHGNATCVGITKAIMLLTQGQIGPAFDRVVRSNLGISAPDSVAKWLEHLGGICKDIRAFEDEYQISIEDLVPKKWKPVKVGRAYDMIAWAIN